MGPVLIFLGAIVLIFVIIAVIVFHTSDKKEPQVVQVNVPSDATIEHKELVRMLDEALKKEHVDSDATIEHKELVRLLDQALELDKHIDSDATIQHKELVRLLDEALEREAKEEKVKKATPAQKKNK